MSARATGADTGPSGNAKHREHHDGSSGRAYTPEQKAAVIRIRRCQATAFYDIMGLQEVKGVCTDSDIKKAYRKLSLLTHPDKNGYEGADEAFKMVARAFGVLSDPDKKAKFDRFGGDPESRFGASSAGASPFGNGFARASQSGGRAGGQMFEEEMTPEELFRQFFGGGTGPFGGGIFDTGPGFVFNVGGGPGFRVHQFGGQRPRRRPGTAQPNGQQAEPTPSLVSTLSSLLPLILLFVFPLLSNLFAGEGHASGPSVRFASQPPHTQIRTSGGLKIPYYVNPKEVERYSAKDWKGLDSYAERSYVGNLEHECETEQLRQARMFQQATGWFYTDQTVLKQAREMKMPSCKRLVDLRRGR